MRDENLFDHPAAFAAASMAFTIFLAALAAALLLGHGWHGGFMSVQSVSGMFPGWLWESLTTLGDERLLLALFLPFCCRYPRVFWTIILAAAIGGLIARGIKLALPMPRPAALLDLGEMIIIGAHRTQHSFVSSHTALAFAFFSIGLALLGWRRALPLFLLACLGGISRIAVGAHWPIDVLAGAAVGLFSGWLAYHVAARSNWGMHSNIQRVLLIVGVIAVISLPLDGQGYPGSLPWRLAATLWGLVGLYLYRFPAREPSLRTDGLRQDRKFNHHCASNAVLAVHRQPRISIPHAIR